MSINFIFYSLPFSLIRLPSFHFIRRGAVTIVRPIVTPVRIGMDSRQVIISCHWHVIGCGQGKSHFYHETYSFDYRRAVNYLAFSIHKSTFGGFYLFTFWSSKQTEPINLPDNRCLTFDFHQPFSRLSIRTSSSAFGFTKTFGLQVQRYDFFSYDNKLFITFLTGGGNLFDILSIAL